MLVIKTLRRPWTFPGIGAFTSAGDFPPDDVVLFFEGLDGHLGHVSDDVGVAVARGRLVNGLSEGCEQVKNGL